MKKLIRTVLVREDGIELRSESEEKFIPIKKKGNKCTVIEPEGKTNNVLLKAVVRCSSVETSARGREICKRRRAEYQN